MSGINSDYSSLFNSLYSNSSSSGSTSSTDFLSNWASLKNGSYKKLTKAYYQKTSDNGAIPIDKEAVSEAVKNNNKVKTNAQNLKSDISKVTDSESLKKFVDSYNSMIDSGAESDSNGILRNTLSMTKITIAHQNSLSDLGITIGEDNKLKLDEETAKKADKSAYDSLFNGIGSYADLISSRASEVVNKANYENNKLSNYTQGGTYSTADSIGKIYDGSY